ncbi:MAG TPA: methylmalonyl Co-A mutase-associated GTPase MeaB [Opitutales bacterium]|nr:methylmalonyl Co-A mutase-associated GTPase MeaB [Opitutales bacterium]
MEGDPHHSGCSGSSTGPILPEWAPEGGGEGFYSEVRPGTEADSAPHRPRKRRTELSMDDYEKGVLSGDRTILARAITLVESNLAVHQEKAAELLRRVQPKSGNCIRVGITGVPGAGKSTLIEAIGTKLCREGHKVAVMAIDPSSTRSGGSVLGDKTRMEELSREPNAFIRPSPSGGALGGVARKSRETLVLCEAAGFDVALIETVGVGQSEVTVRSMVDFFLLVLISGAGDELQGIKKGVIELADLIAINKADGDNVLRARAAMTDMNQVLHYLQPATEGWASRAVTVSAETRDGLDELWKTILEYEKNTRKSGVWDNRRRNQDVEWMHSMINEALRNLFYRDPVIQTLLTRLEGEVAAGRLPPAAATLELLSQFTSRR